MSDQSLLRLILKTTFAQSVAMDWGDLREFLDHPEFPSRAREFKNELADAILHHRITPHEFERLTAIDQDSQEDVDKFLLEEIWNPLYENEPVRIPS